LSPPSLGSSLSLSCPSSFVPFQLIIQIKTIKIFLKPKFDCVTPLFNYFNDSLSNIGGHWNGFFPCTQNLYDLADLSVQLYQPPFSHLSLCIKHYLSSQFSRTHAFEHTAFCLDHTFFGWIHLSNFY
jgi:hypothetical protein